MNNCSPAKLAPNPTHATIPLMVETTVRQLVQAIHDNPTKVVLVTAGAGTQALSDLLGVAGATRTLLEALVPYSQAAFDEFLGQPPAKYVTAETSRLMAGRAFTRARWLETGNRPTVGLACTATIVTDRPKRGEHRAHIAAWQPERLVWYGLYLEKGARVRPGEENMVSRVMLNALSQACSLELQLTLPLREGDRLEVEVNDFHEMAQRLYRRDIHYFCIRDNGCVQTAATPSRAILPGAFNPLHDGHLGLAQVAAEMLGGPVAFEIAAVNVDKPALLPEMVLERLAQFAGRWPVIASNAPTFVEKARLFPGTTFVVGVDTAERILHPRYYGSLGTGSSEENLTAAMAEIQALGCRFLVAGRVGESGEFRHLQDLNIPAQFASLFEPIPDRLFRKDISSSELRRTGQRGSR